MRRTDRRGRTGVHAMVPLLLLGILIAVAATPTFAAKQPPTPIKALDSFAYSFQLGITGSGSGAFNSLTLETRGAYVAPSSQDCTATASRRHDHRRAARGRHRQEGVGRHRRAASHPARRATSTSSASAPPTRRSGTTSTSTSTGGLKGTATTKNGIKVEHLDLANVLDELARLGDVRRRSRRA